MANINPIRYRSYYYDKEIGLYYLNNRYYDPEIMRFISLDDISYLEYDVLGGLNLWTYCNNNPIMYVDPDGNSWWEWLIGGLSFVGGLIACMIPGGQVFGVGLMAAGISITTLAALNAAGVDGKVASLIVSGLSIVAGIVLCFTPLAGLGAGFIGQGIGSIAGGYISESLGGSFELGSAIGGIVGGILGNKIYDMYKFSAIASKGIVIGKMGTFEKVALEKGLEHYSGLRGYKAIEIISPKLAQKFGWANNYNYITKVMRYGGTIYDSGGIVSGMYAKELETIAKWAYKVIHL